MPGETEAKISVLALLDDDDEQNCENTTTKIIETKTKVDFILERANILSKSRLVKLA